MSDIYSLTLVPSRGIIYSEVPRFDNKYFPEHLPDSFNGVRILGSLFNILPGFDTSLSSRNFYFEFSTNTNIVSNGGSSKSLLRMNNSNPSLVTRIGFNTNNSTAFQNFESIRLSPFTPKGRFTIASLQSNGVNQWSSYYITNLTISSETHRFYDLTVQYLGGSATTFSGNPVVFTPLINGSNWRDIPTFLGSPSNPWGITGSKDAINTFLQNNSSYQWQWQDFPSNFEVSQNNESVRLFSPFATSNKSPLDITYNLTKNGVALNSYVHSLVYETKENLDNPFGF
jgi:hypothetical protein